MLLISYKNISNLGISNVEAQQDLRQGGHGDDKSCLDIGGAVFANNISAGLLLPMLVFWVSLLSNGHHVDSSSHVPCLFLCQFAVVCT